YDIGSGNGFPGLIMAAMAPNRSFVMVDSDERKMEFIKHAATVLELKNVRFFVGRVESLPKGSVQAGVTRGFASLSGAILPCRGPFAVGSEFYHLKSSSWGREVAEIPTQACSMWAPKLVRNYRIPESSIEMAVVLTSRLTE
ncbi:MAG: class I SAM-dependent methyltransferase, partial [Bdellovibrionales bacterium]|nr:class I SAM-dependent methyltransferase [Bdellovibrionales bacterium]